MQGTDATPSVQPKGTLLILPPCESLRIQVDDGNGPVDYTGLSRTLKKPKATKGKKKGDDDGSMLF
jgi:hypothetical protein